jgi:hypothetical protein
MLRTGCYERETEAEDGLRLAGCGRAEMGGAGATLATMQA